MSKTNELDSMCGITDDGAVMLVSSLSEKYSDFKQLNLTGRL